MIWFLSRLGQVVPPAYLIALLWFLLILLVMVALAQPARRVAIARIGLAGSLLIWPLFLFSPWPRLDLVATARSIVRPEVEPSQAAAGQAPVDWHADRGPVAVRAASLAQGEIRPGSTLVGLLYLTQVATGLGLLLLAQCAMRRWLRNTRPSRSASTWSVGTNQNLVRPILVREGLSRPCLAGWFRPVIVIPPELEGDASSEARRVCLAHEMAHAQAGDHWFNALAGLARALWIVLPPLWLLERQARIDQELLADRQAARWLSMPLADYATSLSLLAGAMAGGTPERPTRIIRDSAATDPREESVLWLRMISLVRCPFPIEMRTPRFWRIAAWLVAVTLLCGIAMLTIQQPGTRSMGAPTRPGEALEGGHHAGSFTAIRVDLAPAADGVGAASVTLPVAVPRRFELTVEVQATTPEALCLIRVAGIGLLAEPALPPRSESAAASAGPEPGAYEAAWYQLHLRRDAAGVQAWVDEQAVPCETPGPAAGTLLRLSSAPGSDAHFRNLLLTW